MRISACQHANFLTMNSMANTGPWLAETVQADFFVSIVLNAIDLVNTDFSFSSVRGFSPQNMDRVLYHFLSKPVNSGYKNFYQVCSKNLRKEFNTIFPIFQRTYATISDINFTSFASKLRSTTRTPSGRTSYCKVGG